MHTFCSKQGRAAKRVLDMRSWWSCILIDQAQPRMLLKSWSRFRIVVLCEEPVSNFF